LIKVRENLDIERRPRGDDLFGPVQVGKGAKEMSITGE